MQDTPKTQSSPVNLSPIDNSDSAIARDAAYCLQTFQSCLDWLSNTPAQVGPGHCLLELGPGTSYSSALGFAQRGAKIYVADRWLSKWREEYHPALYRKVSELYSSRGQSALSSFFGEVAELGHEPFVTELPESAETLSVADETFDFVFSNAVLEHLFDAPLAMRQLFRVTRPGGYSFHQVDYRDHRDFGRPLEYLLHSRAEYQRLAGSKDNEFGCQYRPDEHAAMFEGAGFVVDKIMPFAPTDPEYLDDFLPRLRNVASSAYCARPRADFEHLGALVIAHRPKTE